MTAAPDRDSLAATFVPHAPDGGTRAVATAPTPPVPPAPADYPGWPAPPASPQGCPVSHPNLYRLLELDSRLVALDRMRGRLLVRLGQVTRPLLRGRTCLALGYSRVTDYCREVLGAAHRTVQRWGTLAQGVEDFPLLGRAFCEGVLNASAALTLLTYLRKHPEEEALRVEQASRKTLAQLQAELGVEPEEEGRRSRTYAFSRSGMVALEQCQELASRMAGASLSRSETLEAVCADWSAGPVPPVDPDQVMELADEDAWERQLARRQELARAAQGWAFLLDNEAERLAGWLAHPDFSGELPESPREKEALALRLLRLDRRIEERMAVELRELRRAGSPTFASVGHYAEVRLSIGHSLANLWIRRLEAAERAPEVRGLSPSQLDALLPLLEAGVDPAAWAAFARRVPCAHLKRWVSALCDLRKVSPVDFEPFRETPPTAADRPELERLLTGVLRRARAFVQDCGIPELGLRMSRNLMYADLRLLQVTGLALLAPLAPVVASLGLALGYAREANQILAPLSGRPAEVTFHFTPEAYRVVLLAEASAEQLLRLSLGRGPAMELVMHTFLATHSELGRRSAAGLRRGMLERDGWRCSVPGCTCRNNLHAHHILFRSRGGADTLENETTVCAGCHLNLIHEGLLKVEGEAPELRWERRDEVFVGQFRTLELEWDPGWRQGYDGVGVDRSGETPVRGRRGRSRGRRGRSRCCAGNPTGDSGGGSGGSGGGGRGWRDPVLALAGYLPGSRRRGRRGSGRDAFYGSVAGGVT